MVLTREELLLLVAAVFERSDRTDGFETCDAFPKSVFDWITGDAGTD